MAMTVIWTGMTVLSLVCALALGRTETLASAALEGAASAVTLGLEMAGALCLWMGVMEVMRRAGLAEKLARLLSPVLRRLFPDFAQDPEVMDTIAANVSANLLGLGNAATPLGLEAAKRMSKRTPGVASDSLCMLVVCNTASIQLIPTTVAAVRMAAGCAAPFDILPAVWVTSGLSVVTGIAAARGMGKLWPRIFDRERREENVAAAGSAGPRHFGRGVGLWHGGGGGRL
jgi:spore maturation protein A